MRMKELKIAYSPRSPHKFTRLAVGHDVLTGPWSSSLVWWLVWGQRRSEPVLGWATTPGVIRPVS